MKELQRLKAVNRFLKLEINKEEEFQEIVDLAASICGTTTALITLIDADTQYIKFKRACDFNVTSREHAFCNYVIEQADILIIPDAREDERFLNNPLVTGFPNIRFYAGVPLTTGDGHILGSLCVIGQSPGELTSTQQKMLKALSRQVIQLLEFDASVKILKDQYLQVRRSETEFRSFFESTIESHLLLGRDFEVLTFNKVWAKFVNDSYGLKLERGMNMKQFLHPENVEIFYSDYLKALNGNPVLVHRKVKKGSQYDWHLVKFEAACDGEGTIMGVSVNSTDITAKVEQEKMVAAQNAALKEIAWIQSHELRRPVVNIMGLMQILREDVNTVKTAELEMMQSEVDELDKKIRLIVDHTNRKIPMTNKC